MNRRRTGRRDRGATARDRGGDARSLGLGLGLDSVWMGSANSSSSRRRAAARARTTARRRSISASSSSSSDAVDASSSDAAVGAARETIWGARTTRGRDGAGLVAVVAAGQDRGCGGRATIEVRAGRERARDVVAVRAVRVRVRARRPRGRATGAVAVHLGGDIRGSTTRARVASLAVAVEPSGVTSRTRTVSSARVRPGHPRAPDRPPRGDLRRARARSPPERNHATREDDEPAVAARHAGRHVFLADGLLAPDSRAHLPSEASGWPRARRAVPFQNIGLHISSFVPRARRVRVHASSHPAGARLCPSSARRLAAKRRRGRSNPDGSDRRIPHRAGRLVTSRRDSPTPSLRRAPRSPGRLFDRRGASAVRLRSTQTGEIILCV